MVERWGLMNLYLIRHAPTHRKSMVGWSDVDADFSDTHRFDELNAFLPHPADLVSSDLRRTVGTADRLAKGRKRLEHSPKLREINFGDWELRTFGEIQETHAEDIRAFYETPGSITAPNGESWNGFYARVHSGFDGLLRQTQGPLIAAVHFGVVIAAVQRALDVSAYEAFSHRIDNLSLTHIRITNGAWAAVCINNTDPLTNS
jgi:broad specificity phosphatase PhoE